jgi:predicted nucleic acid-binding protein
MKLLIDTNIVLEVILEQAKAEEAKALLSAGDKHELFFSDYSLHSVGLILLRRQKHQAFRQLLRDMNLNIGLAVISLAVEDMEGLIESAKRWTLDFDDAYQYAAAEKFNLTIISFDSDFDRTDRGRKTPGDVLRAST